MCGGVVAPQGSAAELRSPEQLGRTEAQGHSMGSIVPRGGLSTQALSDTGEAE